jgi:hypothetical protein
VVILPQQTRAIRVWFCVAAALVAASIGDPLVEFASNRGVFGAGSFTDGSNQDVLPALCTGMLFLVVYVALRAKRMMAGRVVLTSAVCALLPYVFFAQIALLYVMETLEQCATTGHVLGGTIWLGGPPLVSLATHGATCVLTTFLVGKLARALSQKAVTIVAGIVAAIGLAPRTPTVTYLRVSHHAEPRRRAPLLGHAGERAPPLLAA